MLSFDRKRSPQATGLKRFLITRVVSEQEVGGGHYVVKVESGDSLGDDQRKYQQGLVDGQR